MAENCGLFVPTQLYIKLTTVDIIKTYKKHKTAAHSSGNLITNTLKIIVVHPVRDDITL